MKKKGLMTVALMALMSIWGATAEADPKEAPFDPVEYVNPLMGTQSTFELSAGNTDPGSGPGPACPGASTRVRWPDFSGGSHGS